MVWCSGSIQAYVELYKIECGNLCVCIGVCIGGSIIMQLKMCYVCWVD